MEAVEEAGKMRAIFSSRSFVDLLEKIRLGIGRKESYFEGFCGATENLSPSIRKVIYALQIHGKKTVLHYAAQEGNCSAITRLKELGADVTVRSSHGATPLHSAAWSGHADAIKTLISLGASVNAQDDDGEFPLHHASRSGNESAIKVLIEHGAYINVQNKKGQTPLHIAAIEGKHEAVKAFIVSGANLNILNHKGQTALQCAVLNDLYYRCDGHWRPERLKVIRCFKQLGVDMNAQVRGRSVMHVAVEEGTDDIVALLHELDININIKDERGNTPLHYAVRNRHHATIQLLEKCGAHINVQNDVGDTPLHIAVSLSDRTAVILLLKGGADMHVQDVDGNTAFHRAAYVGNCGVMQLLGSHGADIYGRNKKGYTAIHWAAAGHSCEALRYLKKLGCDVDAQNNFGNTPLHLAALKNNYNVIRCLKELGADINAKNQDGDTPIHLAIRNDEYESIQYLILHGAMLDSKNSKGESPREEAHGRAATLLDLIKRLQAKDDPNTMLGQGRNLLMISIENGFKEMVREFLRDERLNINQTDEDGNSALHLAVEEKNTYIAGAEDPTIVEMLLHFKPQIKNQRRLNMYLRNNEGDAAFHLAASKGKMQMVGLFLAAGVEPHMPNGKGKTMKELGRPFYQECKCCLQLNKVHKELKMFDKIKNAVNEKKLVCQNAQRLTSRFYSICPRCFAQRIYAKSPVKT